jgi:ADP-ribose pyrophosphatase YjhB (NUDIX family)
MNEPFDRGRDGRSTDLPTGSGVPAWLAQNLNFCSSCGGQLRFGSVPGEDRERLVCAACGRIAYVNPRLVVTTLPITDAGEIVLIRRGIEPGLGSWAQPGGFLEVDETVNQAAIRETFEETGLLVEPGEIVGLYTRLEAMVVTIAFEARIIGGTAAPTPEATEVTAFAPEAIPWPEIAFRTTVWALRDWIDLRHPELRPGEGGWR